MLLWKGWNGGVGYRAPFANKKKTQAQNIYRDAKCHRYDRYICVKILKGMGKKCSLGVNEVMSLNQLYLIEVAAFSPRRSHFSQFKSVKVSDLSQFTRFSWGKIWFEIL